MQRWAQLQDAFCSVAGNKLEASQGNDAAWHHTLKDMPEPRALN
jgi:hypothetical protein